MTEIGGVDYTRHDVHDGAAWTCELAISRVRTPCRVEEMLSRLLN